MINCLHLRACLLLIITLLGVVSVPSDGDPAELAA